MKHFVLFEVTTDEEDMPVSMAVDQVIHHLANLRGVRLRPQISLGVTVGGLSDVTHFLGDRG